jgi:hypothetical protein
MADSFELVSLGYMLFPPAANGRRSRDVLGFSEPIIL